MKLAALLFCLPVALAAISVAWFFFTPRKTNTWYGYRTRRSMLNDDTWRYANRRGAKAMGVIAAAMLLLSLAMAAWVTEYDEYAKYSVSYLFLVVSSITLVTSVVERGLRKTFDEQGKRLDGSGPSAAAALFYGGGDGGPLYFPAGSEGCPLFSTEETRMAVSYRDLGLVNTREMFKKAMAGKYAIPAYNFNNMEQLQAIIMACSETKSPVILQVSSGARKYANQTMLRYMAQGAVEYAKELGGGANVPICLHLDHGDTYDLCVSCIETGFSSVMIDGSHHEYAKNVELTAKVVEYAHKYDVTVEGELGVLAGVEDEVSAEHHTYTQPEEVEDFVKKTGCDSLAISIGTSHGAYKFKPGQNPQIRLDILAEIEKRIPGFPIVLHGASSVPQELVAKINQYGGKLDDAIGIPEEQLRAAAKSAVCKINIDSDGRLAMTAAVREVFALKPGEFDPRKYLGPARDALKALYKHKCEAVLGSAGHAGD